jgi:hypothetical protein
LISLSDYLKTQAQSTLWHYRVNLDGGERTAMNETSKRFVYGTPRILCIAFAALISMFAMDVFSEPVGIWQKAMDLVIHLIPTGIFLAILAVTWRREWIGGILFPLLAVLHVVKWGFHWSVYVIIDGPLLVIGALVPCVGP